MKRRKIGWKLDSYIRMYYLFLFLFFIEVFFCFALNSTFGIISIMIFVITAVVTFIVKDISKKNIIKYIEEYGMRISDVQNKFLSDLIIPYVLVDINGTIRWTNKAFKNMLDNKKVFNKNIHTFFTDINVEQFPKDEKYFEKDILYNEKYYTLRTNFIEMKLGEEDLEMEESFTSHMYALSFFDITKLVELKQENMDQRTIVSLMFIDNYEEVMQSVDEVRRPLLEGMIYRKLADLAIILEGIVRKLEKDKFICMFPNQNLKIFKDNKFEILDDIRKIKIGNELPPTLSIGVGVHAENLSQSLEYARAGIDLALGRGGDQAVIKNKDKYSFYGGKTKGVEKSTKVKARIKAYAFRELIEDAERVLIMGHKNADLDALGAAIGVYCGVKALNKPAHIVLNSNDFAARNLYERILLEKEYNNQIFLDNIEAIGLTGKKTLLVVVDVNRPDIVECPELLELSKNIAVFDHHRTSVDYIKDAVISYVEPYASSTSEMITEILQYMVEKIKLSPVEADALFAGIALDTKHFTVKTGVRTFEAAAFLRRHGADSIRVKELFKSDMDSYKAKAAAVKEAEIFRDKIAISVCPGNVKNLSVVVAQAADDLLNIKGIEASFVMSETDDKILVSARSNGNINVQLVMEKLGGGGHLTVAATQLYGESIASAKEKLMLVLNEYKKGEE